MNFYRLISPKYSSEVEEKKINGHLHHPYGLPGVDCSACGETWGSTQFLSIECPFDFRERKEIRKRWPVSNTMQSSLRHELLQRKEFSDCTENDLLPGTYFQPGNLEISSPPIADFLWCNPGTLVVSKRMFDLLTSECPDDFTYSRINVDPKLEAGTDYYEIIPKEYSDYPSWRKPKSYCKACLREEVESVDVDLSKGITMTEKMWNGSDLFYLKTTLYIYVTDSLYRKIIAESPTNVSFKEE